MADDQEKKAKFIKLGVSGVVLVIAVVLIVNQFKPPGETIETIWYWDETAKKLVAAPDELSPVRPPGAPATAERTLVRAYIYSCSNCTDAATLTPAYLEKFSDEARGIAPRYSLIGTDGGIIAPLSQVKRTTDTAWLSGGSEEAAALREIKPCADGTPPKLCEKASQ